MPGAFGGPRDVFLPRAAPELLLGRDDVEFVTLLLEVVRVKLKSELLSSDIVGEYSATFSPSIELQLVELRS